MILVDLWYSN